MKTLTNLVLFSILVASCNSPEKEPAKEEAKRPAEESNTVTNCYKYASPSDTISLKLLHVGKSITGTLVYQLKEKDSNKGTIQGAMKDNILVATYTFMSEGVESKRQVAFKLDGNTFHEGYGETMEENGMQTFKNVDSLDFQTSFGLTEVPCQ